MKVHNIMKTIDIDSKEVNPATYNYLLNFHITYRDEVLKEHLINIWEALDVDLREELPENMLINKEIIEIELKKLGELADKNDASYIRFTIY